MHQHQPLQVSPESEGETRIRTLIFNANELHLGASLWRNVAGFHTVNTVGAKMSGTVVIFDFIIILSKKRNYR